MRENSLSDGEPSLRHFCPLSFHSISTTHCRVSNNFHPLPIQRSDFIIPQLLIAGLTPREPQGIILYCIMKFHRLHWSGALVNIALISAAGSLLLGGCSGTSMKQAPVETLLCRNKISDVEFKSRDELPIGIVNPRLEVWILRDRERKAEIELTVRIVSSGRSEIHANAKVPVSRTYRDRSGKFFDRYDGPVAPRDLRGVRIEEVFVQFADSSLANCVDSTRFYGWSR